MSDDALRAELDAIAAVARRYGWNEVGISLPRFFEAALAAKGALATRVVDDVRILPATRTPEQSCALQFGADFPGVFVRGEDAAEFVIALALSVGKIEDARNRASLANLQLLLGSALLASDGSLREGLFANNTPPYLTLVKSDKDTSE